MRNRFVQFILWLLAKQGIPSIVPWAFGMIRSLYDTEPGAYLDLLETQREREDWIHHFFVAHELGELYSTYPDTVLDHLRELSSSDVEIVREGAARSWSKLLESDFERAFGELEELRSGGSYEERYTAAIAPVRYVRENAPLPGDRRKRLLNYWNDYEDDPKQGLWNIVRTQILPEIEDDDGERS